MGDLGEEEETEKLDERMWGSDDEDDDEDKADEKKEEKGKGMDAVSDRKLLVTIFRKFIYRIVINQFGRYQAI